MGGEDKSPANHNSLQRVKVYRLNDAGKWDDQGTGHVTIDYMERSECLFVTDEDDNETLLLHRISPEDIYRKQEDTIISWRDPEYSTELALSFQEPAGCSYIWDNICSVQRSSQFNALNGETFQSVNSELRELPAVELSTLPLILKNVVESGIADQIRVTELILNDQGFFRKLMDLFKICEDMKNKEGLLMIHKLVKGIILLNSPQIFEKIFSDELFMDIIGCFEYDPDAKNVQHHRDFLKEHVVFKEAIPIKDPLVLSKIHQTYRVGYLKDVILPKSLDEATIANLTSMIQSNNAIVVSLLKDDSTFIQELFARLRSATTSAESKRNLVFFLHEFCSLSKSLQMVQQIRLYRDLISEGIFDIITDILQSPDKRLVLTGTDILILFLNQDPNLLRHYVMKQEGIPLLGLLVKGMLTDFGEDMHCQFLEILRSILDSYTLSGSQRDTIIDIFYEKYLGQLVDVIISSCPSEDSTPVGSQSSTSGEEVGNHISAKPEILSNICELLCFCVLHHPFRIKCNFLLNNVIDKVLLLTRRREKYLVVAAVRFVRIILSRHDEHLINHVVKNNLLKPIVDAFVSNGDRYNLLNSAVLELFEYIQRENLKSLLKYIFDSFWHQLVKFESLSTVQSLKVKYEQSLEAYETESTTNVLDTRKRVDERALEKEEEDYFNEDSDEEDTASARTPNTHKVQAQPGVPNGSPAATTSLSPRSGGLVDYADDEDDEDYRPPPKKQPEACDDEGTVESLEKLKRKLHSKEQEGEPRKKQRLCKIPNSKSSVFAALCSTLSQSVLPGKKNEDCVPSVPSAQGETKRLKEVEPTTSGSCLDDNQSLAEESNDGKEMVLLPLKSGSDCLHNASENRQCSGEDCSPISSPNSSEMAVNGS